MERRHTRDLQEEFSKGGIRMNAWHCACFGTASLYRDSGGQWQDVFAENTVYESGPACFLPTSALINAPKPHALAINPAITRLRKSGDRCLYTLTKSPLQLQPLE